VPHAAVPPPAQVQTRPKQRLQPKQPNLWISLKQKPPIVCQIAHKSPAVVTTDAVGIAPTSVTAHATRKPANAKETSFVFPIAPTRNAVPTDAAAAARTFVAI